MVLIDADVMIELMRKNYSAKSFLVNEVGNENIILSCITVAEILQGANNKENLHQINKLLNQYIVIPIDYQVSGIFSTLFQKYVLSHGTGISDTLVAATALHLNLPLLSINRKHFKHIPNLKLVDHDITPLKGKSFLP
ncbi:MAG: type II toxin-antitoxin system VapC family toxin [Bacteroidota bacterium]|nr:type II toxin-antitoxin system VapC family toxin [Bacteroidota bacterium]